MMHLIALLTQYSFRSGGFRVRNVMDAGSLFDLLEVTHHDVIIRAQLAGNDVALSPAYVFYTTCVHFTCPLLFLVLQSKQKTIKTMELRLFLF